MGGVSLRVQASRHVRAQGHDQLQLFLHGTGRYMKLRGDVLMAAAVQSAEAEDALLAHGELRNACIQAFQQPFSMHRVSQTAGSRSDALHDRQWHIICQRALTQAARAQMIQRQVARGTKYEGLKVMDQTFVQGPTHAQVGFMQQIFSGTGVAHHALQGVQQA